MILHRIRFFIVYYSECWVCSKGVCNKRPNTGICAQLILGEATEMGIKATLNTIQHNAQQGNKYNISYTILLT